MERFHLPSRDHPPGSWVALLAVLILAGLPLLAASAFSAPVAQTLQPVAYLPLVMVPPRSQIAFVSYRDGNIEIYVMNVDGSDQTNLTNNLGSDLEPVWSPDGRRIAFSANRDGNWEIYVMNADGSNPTNLTNNLASDGPAVWSPSGRQLAFVSERDGKGDIYLMNADGSNPTRLTKDPMWAAQPAWSPTMH